MISTLSFINIFPRNFKRNTTEIWNVLSALLQRISGTISTLFKQRQSVALLQAAHKKAIINIDSG